MPRLLAALVALALAERRLNELRAAALRRGRDCGLLFCGFRTTTPFALARRFRLVLSCGTPCHAGSAGLAGNCRRRSRRLASFPLALAVARTELRSITAACCRRPGFGRLFAVIGVFHLSQPWRRASPGAAQGALSIFVGATVPAPAPFAKLFLTAPPRAKPAYRQHCRRRSRSASFVRHAHLCRSPTNARHHDVPSAPANRCKRSGRHIEIAFFCQKVFALVALLFISPPHRRDGQRPPATLGNRLTVDQRTLTPLVLVRIQVPQPNSSCN